MSFTSELTHFEVNVTSREMIKPLFPTPSHKNTLKFSLLDQFAATFHTPILLFYQNDVNNLPNNNLINLSSERSVTLRKSLSETLVHFYPLAGRIRANESIDCNDEGVEFCEANVNEKLTNVISNPDLEILQELLPFTTAPNHKNIVLSVQLNHFTCGGMAIGVRISHKIADTASATAFVKAWATIAQAGNDKAVAYPEWNASSIYPPVEELHEFYPGDVMTPYYAEKIVSKRVVFDKEKIDELKAQTSVTTSSNPTRVEVVSAFIWKHMMGVEDAKIDTAMHAVNFRKRVIPQVPEQTFGNFSCTTSTSPNGPKTGFSDLVQSLKKAINKIDDNYLTPKLKGDQPLVDISNERENLVQGENKCLFSSWCTFPLYEVDFGLGSPIWACHGASPMKNVVVLWSTKCGNGIEAWVHMLEDHIATLVLNLQQDPLFA